MDYSQQAEGTLGAPLLVPDVGRWKQIRILLGLNALYIGFGLIMGVVNGGLPTVMRAQGISITDAGWLYLLYLPFGLTFLWAPLVDRIRLPLPLLSQRLGWIVLMQLLAVTILLVISKGENLPVWQLFALGFLVSLAIATMDIALDALAVKTITADWRSVAAATKLAALAGGSMLGGGAFVVLFAELGWQTSFVLLAGFMLLLLVPALPLVGLDRRVQNLSYASAGSQASLRRLFVTPHLRKRLLLLTLTCCVIFPLAGLNRLMLIDLGIAIEQIGWVVGTLGPLSMLVVAAGSMPLMKYLGLSKTMLIFAALAFLALALMGYGYLASQQLIAMTGAVIIGAGVSGIYITVAAKILGWSVGSQPATDYAAYYGISRFGSTLMTVATASMISLLGWGLFYGLGALALLLVVFTLKDLIGSQDNAV